MNGNQGYAVNRTADTPPVPTPVSSAVAQLDAANSRLHERISSLTQRLEHVLAPMGPQGVGENAKLARHSLALQIESEAAKVNGAADRLDDIITRLEL